MNVLKVYMELEITELQVSKELILEYQLQSARNNI